MSMEKDKKWNSIIDNKYFGQVSELLKLYDSIYSLYQELSRLEKEGLKDTEEYNNIYNLIPHCIALETKIVKKFDTFTSNELQELKDQITYLIDNTESELIDKTDFYVSNKFKRLFSRIRDYAFLRNDSYDLEPIDEEEEEAEYELSKETTVQVSFQGKTANVPMSDLEKFIDKYSGKQKQKQKESQEERKKEKEHDKIVNTAWYQRFALTDINFYKRIEKEIENTENPILKNILIDYKYNLLYNSIALENRFAKEKDSSKWVDLKHIIELLAEEYPWEYQINYSEGIEYEIKYKLALLFSKQFDPNDQLDLLDNKVDMLYIKSLMDNLIRKQSVKNINALLNTASNEKKLNIEQKNNLIELKNTAKELKLKK